MTLAKAISQTSLPLGGCFIMSLRKLDRFVISALSLILGLIFASWASRIPDVQKALALNDAQLLPPCLIPTSALKTHTTAQR
jgi:hypothetical protein